MVEMTGNILFHPDYTVGLGISPNQPMRKHRLAGLQCMLLTAGGELRPALRIILIYHNIYACQRYFKIKKNYIDRRHLISA